MPEREDTRPIKVEVRNLTKRFGDLLVLDDMSFNVCSRAYRLRKDHIFKLPYQDSYAQPGRSVYRRSPCGPAQT